MYSKPTLSDFLFVFLSLPKNENLFQFFQIQSLIQISHKLNWFGLMREELMTIFLKTTYKIVTKINVVNCSLTKRNESWQKCNDFSLTKNMKYSNN